ncbi:hypothetical protein CAEBREN_18267 [Caenorhabditis brenneri]|uniref:Uncharacterized protein n=1 Tax=Caenorhabditis brenneri TaxID=135651 RepID=G0MJC8_CAEBE|nr:hypothetical protein CAEBREN_18267 [Caenorhabditis brenneri]
MKSDHRTIFLTSVLKFQVDKIGM